MTPSLERTSKVLEEDRLWIYRDFVKEKLRNRERYWRPTTDLPVFVGKESSGSCWVVPDGIIWRKYLPFLSHLVKESQCNLLLLESAVDLMDYRSISPVIECNVENDSDCTWQPEKPAPQERSKIAKLATLFSGRVFPFCDLSIREEDGHDEFDMMDYKSISIVDRSQHALMRTAGLLRQKIGNNKKIIIVSTQDLKAKYPSEDGFQLLQMDNFITELLALHPHLNEEVLMNLKRSCEEEYKVRNMARSKSVESNSREFLSEDQVREGLKTKTLFKGRLEVSKHNPKEGTVATSDGGKYFIDQKLGYFNRSFHHDVVVIEVLPKTEWGSPVGKRRLVHHRDDDDETDTTSFDVDSAPPVPSARVVAISESSRRRFVATMVDSPMNDDSACIVTPMDIRIPKIRIKTNGWNRFVGQRLLIQVDSWDIDSNYPAGHCHEIVGPIGDLETEISCLLHEHELHLEPFSAGALACLPSEGSDWKIPPEEIEKRRDLRESYRIFSVDPPGCQDIDDTMHARELPNGDIEIGVHIADVTHFVPHNSPLDLEAQVRATTFYLVDRRFDMLPSLLSSDLCSLHGSTDRLAVSTIWIFSRDFKEVKSFWYGRTVIHNCQAMTYGQAHNIIHDQPPDEGNRIPPPLTAGAPVDPANVKNLKKDLTILTRLARKLRKDREDVGGAVDLSSGDQGNELKFTLDKDSNPIQVTAKKQMEIHNTIAELMILSNTWVAKTIYDKSPDSALLRNHRSVEDSRFEDLKAVLDAGKIAFDGKDNMALANSLKAAETATKLNSTMQSLFQSLATRAMSEAQYVCTGQVGKDQLSHYGLGLQKYTHFTSPIRRYADVVVHKQLLSAAAPPGNHSDASTVKSRTEVDNALVPDSKTISILAGEGIRTRDETIETPDETEPNDNVVVTESQEPPELENEFSVERVYSPRLVAKICDILNRQNRMAKLSSMECQHLFLSIYFRKHVEVTKAVVVDLRANGLWVYVPLFDMRGPVYLSDTNGRVQVDPRLLGLDPSTGEDPTLAFEASPYARMIPSSDCMLVESPDRHLKVTAPKAKSPYTLRVLDVVTVQISCDSWDVRSRIPMPKIHLIADSSGKKISFNAYGQTSKSPITSSTLQESQDDTNEGPVEANPQEWASMYSELAKLETPPVLVEMQFTSNIRKAKSDACSISVIPGRMVFGGFRNLDTRSALQEAAIDEAAESAEQRRAQALAGAARSSEYDTTRRIEKDITSRMQRLKANKRNTRKAKGK
ncbi:unnamed protein product [Cylindrotheca closterium]|uniref:DIS3-like exonuclease 1 n=1 Tax=Cylindrotheca closterium TaxID=2856 RepID=A0AAD2FQK4_9STRA|nr:unnamed protein product [Cylindrotheca closterium]